MVVGLGEQVGDGRAEHRRRPDADEHEPVPGQPAPDGDRDDGHRGEQRPGQRAEHGGHPRAAEDGQHHQGADRGAGVHADDVRAHERIRRDPLQDRAGEREGRADPESGDRAGQAVADDDVVLDERAAAPQDPQDVGDGDVEPAQGQRQRGEDDGGRPREHRQHGGTPVEPEHDRVPTGAQQQGARACGAHSCATFRLRTRCRKNGAPTSPRTMPTWSCSGRTSTRPSTSASSRTVGASSTHHGRIHR